MSVLKKIFPPEQPPENLIVCAVYGGIIHRTPEHWVNDSMMGFLNLGKKEGYEVVMVASDPASAQAHVKDACKTWFDDAQYFGKVRTPDALQGRKAWVVVDGDEDLKSIEAVSHWHPEYDAVQVAKMRCFWTMERLEHKAK